MKYIIFSDMHGNIEAYRAVLEVAKAQDREIRYFCVGDIVGYGADPIACIETTQHLGPTIVAGNHDWAVCGRCSIDYFNPYAKKAVLWTESVLDKDKRDYLRSLELIYIGEEMTLVHGTLMHPESFEYIFDLDTALRMAKMMVTWIGFIGHSHIPGIFSLLGDSIEYTTGPKVILSKERKYIVNVGSVGQPRDGDWRASFCVWDREEDTIEIKRVEYNIKKTQKKILEADLPEVLAYRLGEGR